MPDAFEAPSPLDYSAHPHIIERIIELSDPIPRLHLRLLSRSLRRTIDRALLAHLAISQREDARWLDWRVSSGLRLPSSYGRKVAAQIVDPALLLQRSFAGVLFRLVPEDVAWLEATLALTRSVSIVGDVWYGNRTLPFGALASVSSRSVPLLRLLPAIEREVAGTHYPSLHPFTSARVEVVAVIPEGTRYDRSWVGMTTLLPPGVEEVRISLSAGAQEWGTDRGRPIDYPESVRRVDIDLDIDALSAEGLRIVAYKLFRHFRPEIEWRVTGVETEDLFGHIARAAGAELDEVRAATTIDSRV